MSDLTSLAERARADASPIAAAPLEQIEQRAYARGRRRKVATGAVCAAVVVTVLLVGIAFGASRSDTRLDVVSPSTVPTTAPPAVPVPPPATSSAVVVPPTTTPPTVVTLPPSTSVPPTTMAPTTSPPTTRPQATPSTVPVVPTTILEPVLDCPSIPWGENTDSGYSLIKVTGMSCEEADTWLRTFAVASPRYPRPSQFTYEGYSCTENEVHEGLYHFDITCTSGSRRISWTST